MRTKLLLITSLLILGLSGCGSGTGKGEKPICQSCAMPLVSESDFGSEVDGMQSSDYCIYCYQDGAFTYDCTMEEMLGFCEQHMDTIKPADMTAEAFMRHLREVFPTLKRWKEQ